MNDKKNKKRFHGRDLGSTKINIVTNIWFLEKKKKKNAIPTFFSKSNFKEEMKGIRMKTFQEKNKIIDLMIAHTHPKLDLETRVT